ncbi:MAG: hypothetical protein O2999_13310 [Nitrospirae bacterium]|nr:hypothetical protein [Nitrospirota bacterium]MDA1305252.1 hypothetical protein [Nitrospirota bacterium]
MKRNACIVGMILSCAVGWGIPSSHAYELWVADQSDTAKEMGGFLYIYDGEKLGADPAKAQPLVTMDLGKEVNDFCQKATQKAVRRPHMIFVTKDQKHALLSFLSGHVLVMDTATRKPVACVSTGKNVHAAWPTPDQSMALAANIPEKKLIRIWTNYQSGTFTFDPQKDVLDLGALESGERPDNAPICPITEQTSTSAFVTLRGGGLLVVNVKDTPMKVTATLTDVQVHPAGCGGYQVGNTMYINSGGGWPVAPLAYDVYAVNLSKLPGTVEAKLVSTRDTQFSDSHGLGGVGRYLWSVDRAGNMIEVIDSVSNLSVNTIQMVGPHSDDPAPDLIDFAPDGSYAFLNLRGPSPLTGNHKDVNNAKGSTPGVAVLKVLQEGKSGEVVGIAPLTNKANGNETADPHGIAVVNR